MSEVRARAGVPVTANFAGVGSPTVCSPVVVDSTSGILYTLQTGDVVFASGAGGTVTNIATGTGLTGGPITGTGTISMSSTITAAGPTGGAATVPVITYNAQGQLTTVTTASITPLAIGALGATASAGGDLTGNYPNPTIKTSVSLTTPVLGVASATSINFGTSALGSYKEAQAWTPNQGSGLTLVGAFSSSGTYTRAGNIVVANGRVNGATSVAVSAVGDICSNLPESGAGGTGIFFGGAVNNAFSVFSIAATSSARLICASAISATPTIYFTIVYTI